jgi:hypothetical protein
VLTGRVSLVLDVALDAVVAGVLGEPSVVADDAVCLLGTESDDGLELHVGCVLWLSWEMPFIEIKKSISIFLTPQTMLTLNYLWPTCDIYGQPTLLCSAIVDIRIH